LVGICHLGVAQDSQNLTSGNSFSVVNFKGPYKTIKNLDDFHLLFNGKFQPITFGPIALRSVQKYDLTGFVFNCSCYPFLPWNLALMASWICYADFVTCDAIPILMECMQTTCHGMSFFPHYSLRLVIILFVCFSVTILCFFSLNVVVMFLILQLFEYNLPIWISWWNNFFTLILCSHLNHKVDKRVSVLLLSSSNIGYHGTTPRFRVCVFPQMFVNTLFVSSPIMYLVTFVKALLFDVQLNQKYLLEI
jgi:hypothetical protein